MLLLGKFNNKKKEERIEELNKKVGDKLTG